MNKRNKFIAIGISVAPNAVAYFTIGVDRLTDCFHLKVRGIVEGKHDPSLSKQVSRRIHDEVFIRLKLNYINSDLDYPMYHLDWEGSHGPFQFEGTTR